MYSQYIQTSDGNFVINGKRVMLRGFSIGSWMNMESFMIRIPGSERRIRQIFAEVYGQENADKFFEGYLNCFITEDDFLILKDLGINVLRIPFGYSHFEDDQYPGNIKLEGFKHLDRILELCRKYGIYAILDMHSSPGGQNPDSHGGGDSGDSEFWKDASLRERIINLWGAIADKYKDEYIIAGFDILNEPCFISDIDAFNDFYETVIQRIRDVDNNHIIFLEGEDWAKDFSVFRKLGGYQQAISFHFYPGQHVYMSTERHERKVQLEEKLQYFIDLKEKTGMPLWVGETGGHFPKDKLLEGMELVKDCIDLFEKYGISWTIWSYKDVGAMGMIYPKEDTKWISLTDEFRLKWQAKGRSNPTIANEIFNLLESQFSYEIDDKIREILKFRIFAFLNEIHLNYLVKPKLKLIPWEEMKEYPKSFLLQNCDGSAELADLVKSYTVDANR